jgi:hypothetical protein
MATFVVVENSTIGMGTHESLQYKEYLVMDMEQNAHHKGPFD